MTLEVGDYIENNKPRFLSELLELLKIPSVSADPEYKDQVVLMANKVAEHLETAGVQNVKIYPTAGHPIVYGEHLISTSVPTVLVYGHYDVQPADPLELWTTSPFDPVIRDGNIYARGACDDKGQFFMHIKAFEAMNKTQALNCNIKFIFEGEEEIGSNNLEQFCTTHRDMLACDVVMISDTALISNELPSLTVGLRGLSYVEVEVTGPNRDLHSGVYGGGVTNPINALSKMIASLHDSEQRITIPGFYDKIKVVSEAERAEMNAAPFDLEEYEKDLGINAVTGEQGFTTLERTSIRPTLDVNGIWGGYIGAGAKTVLPSKAFAKISMRLVPDQDPDEITKLFSDHFISIASAGTEVKVTPHHGGHPAVTPTDSLEYLAAERAMTDSFGVKPLPQRGGGSIPIVSLFEKVLGVKTVMMGFGLDSDNIHSPNEKYGLFNFYKGIETIPHFYRHYAELKKS
ncbi:MAG: dipeptidase [Saprospiraceae bacterium]|nr:dipeptidase [Saprospiraceae bacterium]